MATHPRQIDGMRMHHPSGRQAWRAFIAAMAIALVLGMAWPFAMSHAHAEPGQDGPCAAHASHGQAAPTSADENPGTAAGEAAACTLLCCLACASAMVVPGTGTASRLARAAHRSADDRRPRHLYRSGPGRPPRR